MSVNAGWEQRGWGGAPGLREERSRARRRLQLVALTGAVFLYALLQVRMSTEVAAVGTRVNQRQAEVKRLEGDLKVLRTTLSQRQIFGELIQPAEAEGFGPGGEYRTISVAQATAAEPTDVWRQLGGELQHGAELILPAALAQEVLGAGQESSHRSEVLGRTDRPKDRDRAYTP